MVLNTQGSVYKDLYRIGATKVGTTPHAKILSRNSSIQIVLYWQEGEVNLLLGLLKGTEQTILCQNSFWQTWIPKYCKQQSKIQQIYT